jgi:hypothetical protein
VPLAPATSSTSVPLAPASSSTDSNILEVKPLPPPAPDSGAANGAAKTEGNVSEDGTKKIIL